MNLPVREARAFANTAIMKAATKPVPQVDNVVFLFVGKPADKDSDIISAQKINQIFGIASSDNQLQPIQLRRQQALQDAIIAFTAPVAYEVTTSKPIWSLPTIPMQMQQQMGAQISMTDEERTAIHQRQIAAQRAAMKPSVK